MDNFGMILIFNIIIYHSLGMHYVNNKIRHSLTKEDQISFIFNAYKKRSMKKYKYYQIMSYYCHIRALLDT